MIKVNHTILGVTFSAFVKYFFLIADLLGDLDLILDLRVLTILLTKSNALPVNVHGK